MYNEFNYDYPDLSLLIPRDKIKSSKKPENHKNKDDDYPDLSLLIPRDKIKSSKKSKNHKNSKNKDDDYLEEEFDYSEMNYDGDKRKLLRDIADSIEGYLDSIDTYFIFEGMNNGDWKKLKKATKKFIKKLRKGDPSVLDMEVFNEVVSSGHLIMM